MIIDIDLTHDESKLLCAAVDTLKQANQSLTRARLDVGRAMCNVIVSRHERGYSSRSTRILLADYMRRHTGDTVEIGRLVNVYQTVVLLGDGDSGDLTWSSLFRMYHLIQQREDKWYIRSGYETKARELFAKARTGKWSSNTTARAVGELVGKPVQVISGSVKRIRGKYNKIDTKPIKTDPRDMADHIAEMIFKHHDSRRVMRVLMENSRFVKLLETVDVACK